MPFELPTVENPFNKPFISGIPGIAEPSNGLPVEDTDTAWNSSLDLEGDEKALKDALPPAGTYIVKGLESNLGDHKVVNGRRLITYQGNVYRDGQVVRLVFTISPDRAKSPNDPTKWAYDFTLFDSTREAYTKAVGQKPTTIEELDTFLRTKEYGIQLYRGRNSMGVNRFVSLSS